MRTGVIHRRPGAMVVTGDPPAGPWITPAQQSVHGACLASQAVLSLRPSYDYRKQGRGRCCLRFASHTVTLDNLMLIEGGESRSGRGLRSA